jgi:hypothetical protein
MLRLAPAIYGWAERRRVYRLYLELKRLEDELVSAAPGRRCTELVERLSQLEDRASRISVLVSIRPLVYGLRWHIEMVRQQVKKSDALWLKNNG